MVCDFIEAFELSQSKPISKVLEVKMETSLLGQMISIHAVEDYFLIFSKND